MDSAMVSAHEDLEGAGIPFPGPDRQFGIG